MTWRLVGWSSTSRIRLRSACASCTLGRRRGTNTCVADSSMPSPPSMSSTRPSGNSTVNQHRGAFALHAVHADFAAHQLGQAAADGEAEARAAVAARGAGFRLRERLEQTALRFLADTDTGVAHAELDALAACIAGHAAQVHQHAAGLGELHRVGEEVAQDLPHPHRVGHVRACDVLVDVEGEVEALARSRTEEIVGGRGDELAQADRHQRQI